MKVVLLVLLSVLTAGDGVGGGGDEKCKVSSDCQLYNHCSNEICKHKEIFPLGGMEWLASVILIVIASIANAAGVGGSVISTSLNLSLFHFGTHQAVALTQCFIFAGTFTSVSLKLRDRHPTRDRPLIYYDVLMQLCSPLLLGVSIGVMLNPAFPSWLILAILTVVIAYLTINSILDSINLYKKESIVKRQLADQIKEAGFITEPAITGNDKSENQKSNIENEILDRDSEIENSDRSNSSVSNVSEIQRVSTPPIEIGLAKSEPPGEDKYARYKFLEKGLYEKIMKIHKIESQVLSIFNFIYFALLIIFSILFALLKGNGSTKSIAGIPSCGGGFAGIIIAYIVSMLMLSVYSSVFLIKKTKICDEAGYDYENGDIKWHTKKCIVFVVVGIITGLLAGILGLGAGYIIGPILLKLKIRPEIATVSSSFTILITAFTAAIQFFIAGTIDWRYALWSMALSVIGAFIGILVVRKQAIRLGRSSILIISFSIILFCSLVIIPAVGISTTIKQDHDGTLKLGFQSIC